MNLLIVDDDAVNRKLLRAQLEAEGHRVFDATNGIEALQVLERESQVEGIVSDILMPDMDGFQLCLEVRKSKKLSMLPFIFYTSTYSSPQDQQLAKTVGGDNYLSKPSPTPVILGALHEAAQRTRPRIATEVAKQDDTYVLKQYNAALVRKLEQRNIELEQAFRQLENLNRIYAMLSGINTLIVRVNNRQELFDGACRIAVEHGGFGIVWVGVLNPQTLNISVAASAGVDAESLLARSGNTAQPDSPLGQGFAGRAFREKRAVFSNDLTLETTQGGERRKEAIRRGYRSLIVLPLPVEGAVTEILSLFANEKDFFNKDEVSLLTELAGNISFALEHMARQEKIAKLSRIRAVSSEINAAIVRIREREALLQETCRIATEHGKFEMVWVGTIDSEKQEIRPVAWSGFSEETARRVSWTSTSAAQGALGEAVRTGMPAVRNDIEAQLPTGGMRGEAVRRGYHSTVALPLVVDGSVVALIVLFATGTGFFDKDELALLQEVAADVSFALDHIAKQQKIEKLSRVRHVLGEINAAITRIHDKTALFDAACRIAADAGRFPFVWIGTYDLNEKQVKPVAWAGAGTGYFAYMNSPRPVNGAALGTGAVAMAVTEKKAVIVNNVQNDPRISRKKLHLDQGTNSIAVLPFVVSGEVAGVMALHAREAGFFDDEEKNLLFELAGDIAFALQTIEKQEKIDYLSYYDPLTDLPNRSLFIDRLGQQLHARGTEQRMVAIILLNLERFRFINETLGRHGGDELLRLVAQRLERIFHGKDYLARVGADGFGVVIRGVRDTAAVAHALQDQVLGCFHEPFRLNGNELRVAAKAGVAVFPADGGDTDTLFKNAEAALKIARESGERYLFYAAEMNARAAQVLSLETRLRKAVEAQEFVLHYQPKIALADGKICGMEALIRWQDPATGLVPPGTFIPLLEETGLILEVGKWALGQALIQHREWTAAGLPVPRIAVNVSPIQLQQKDFADVVINAVQEQGDNPDALELEVTESLLMKDVQASIRKLTILRGMGITIAMDDFGTGYSSLAYLARLPINSLKIDRSFITGMTDSPQDMGIVTTIIALAHSMTLKVVAEGVETAEQSQLLKLLKCDEAQGYLFSKPLPPEQIEPLLRAQAQETKPPR